MGRGRDQFVDIKTKNLIEEICSFEEFKKSLDAERFPKSRDQLLNPKEPNLKALAKMLLNNLDGSSLLFRYIDIKFQQFEKRIEARDRSIRILSSQLGEITHKHNKNQYFFNFLAQTIDKPLNKVGKRNLNLSPADAIRLYIKIHWKMHDIQKMIKVVDPNCVLSESELNEELYKKFRSLYDNRNNTMNKKRRLSKKSNTNIR